MASQDRRAKPLLPVFADVERPLEFEVRDIVVVNEAGNGVVMTTSQHPRRRFLLGELLLVNRLSGGAGRVTADHFLVFVDADTVALEDLDVFEAREHLMLNDKGRLHLVLTSLLDGERLLLQRLEGAWV